MAGFFMTEKQLYYFIPQQGRTKDYSIDTLQVHPCNAQHITSLLCDGRWSRILYSSLYPRVDLDLDHKPHCGIYTSFSIEVYCRCVQNGRIWSLSVRVAFLKHQSALSAASECLYVLSDDLKRLVINVAVMHVDIKHYQGSI